MDDIKTGAKLIGLIPCGESRPYIFLRRPDELHNYYRFRDVVILKDKSGTITTSNYGKLYTYITKFRDYVPINSCSECKPAAPTETPRVSDAVIDCSTWILQKSADQLPELNEDQELEKIGADLEQYINGVEIQEKCVEDRECANRETASRLGNDLGEILRQRNAPLEKLILLLKALLTDPQRWKVCQQISEVVWWMSIGINQQGYALELVSVTSPATHLATDAVGQKTGILEDGTLVEGIPVSGVIVTNLTQYILFPAGTPVMIQVRGTGFGAVSVRMIHNTGTVIQNALFEGVLFTKDTQSELNLSNLQPMLKVDALNDGNFEIHQPDSYQEVPLLVKWNPTAIPTQTIPPTLPPPSPTFSIAQVTSTPISSIIEPTATNSAPEKPSTPLACPLSLGLATLPIARLCRSKLRKS